MPASSMPFNLLQFHEEVRVAEAASLLDQCFIKKDFKP